MVASLVQLTLIAAVIYVVVRVRRQGDRSTEPLVHGLWRPAAAVATVLAIQAIVTVGWQSAVISPAFAVENIGRSVRPSRLAAPCIVAVLLWLVLRSAWRDRLAMPVAAIGATFLDPIIVGHPSYWSELLLTVQPGPDVLVFPLGLAVSLVLFLRLLRPALTGVGLDRPPLVQGIAMSHQHSRNEPQRLIEGAAACGRLPGAAALIAEEHNESDARPFEVGLDRARIIEAIRAREGKDFARGLVYAVPAAAALVVVGSGMAEPAIFLALGGLVVLSGTYWMICLYRDRYGTAEGYRPETFDKAWRPSDDAAANEVIVHSGPDPFDAFGTPFGEWVLVVDVERSKDGGAPPSEPVDTAAIEANIMKALTRSGDGDITEEVVYVAQGRNLPEELLPSPEGPPRAETTPGIRARVSAAPNGPVRRYVKLTRQAWSGDLALTYFLRLYRSGGDLALEMQGLVLPPVGERYRWVDRVPPATPRRVVGDLTVAPFAGAVMMVWAPLRSVVYLLGEIALAFADPAETKRREVRNTPDHDFGATRALRRTAADPRGMWHFLTMDRRLEAIAINGRIVRAFIDHLDARGIDTTELREQRTMMMNQGIIVNNGDVNAQNLAAGVGARIQQGLGGAGRAHGRRQGAAA